MTEPLAIHVCGGGPYSRHVFACPVCKTRRCAVSQHVFGGYGSNFYCGGCGSLWQDLEPLRTHQCKTDMARNREIVKQAWPKARRLRIVLDELLSEGTDAPPDLKANRPKHQFADIGGKR